MWVLRCFLKIKSKNIPRICVLYLDNACDAFDHDAAVNGVYGRGRDLADVCARVVVSERLEHGRQHARNEPDRPRHRKSRSAPLKGVHKPHIGSRYKDKLL